VSLIQRSSSDGTKRSGPAPPPMRIQQRDTRRGEPPHKHPGQRPDASPPTPRRPCARSPNGCAGRQRLRRAGHGTCRGPAASRSSPLTCSPTAQARRRDAPPCHRPCQPVAVLHPKLSTRIQAGKVLYLAKRGRKTRAAAAGVRRDRLVAMFTRDHAAAPRLDYLAALNELGRDRAAPILRALRRVDDARDGGGGHTPRLRLTSRPRPPAACVVIFAPVSGSFRARTSHA
jgi:hypothetical protein